MARIDTVRESNGPDRFNRNPGCARHHAGVRTGISDSCCCCDPCNYRRKNNSAAQPEDRFCCRCFPRLILAKFTETNADGCCRDSMEPMLGRMGTVNGKDAIIYTGSIVGYAIEVSISNDPVDSYGDDPYAPHCMWTVSIPYLGIQEEFEIDHTVVTCLGVPAIEITNIPAQNGCIGTISLANYATAKVPFQNSRTSDPYLVDDEELTVPFPEDFWQYGGCDRLPRFICVSKKRIREHRIRSPHVPWEIDWARSFEWDYEFEPYERYTEQEWVIGVWTHTPEDPAAYVQHLYLIQDAYGEFHIQPDFQSPAGWDLEQYQRVPLSSCGCDFKILDVRPVNDPSPPLVPGESVPADLLGIDYRGGQCGCWSYFCGRRRCVPRYLCGWAFVNNTLYRNILFVWDNDSKCWHGQGGEDFATGYAPPFDLSICLDRNDAGECVLKTSFEDYDLNDILIGDLDTAFSGNIQGRNYEGTGYFSLNFSTSFDGQCGLVVRCSTATPCLTECGSHPDKLHLRLHGWSTASDYPPPPVTGECETEIDLAYVQSITVVGDGIVYVCGYVGYKLVDSLYRDPFGVEPDSRRTFLIKAELNLGQLKIWRKLADDPNDYEPVETVTLDQSCDPYYGYKLTVASLRSCFFGDAEILFHRWEAEVTE